MAAVVDEIFHQTACVRALRFGGGEELEEPCLRLKLAAIPIPPVAAVPEFQVGRLVLLIALEELADVADDIIAFLDVLRAMQLQPEQGLRIDRQVVLVAEKEALHLFVVLAALAEHAADQGIHGVGFLLRVRLALLPIRDPVDLLFLMLREPCEAALNHVVRDLRAVVAGKDQAVQHHRRGVRIRVVSIRGEPSPAAVGILLDAQFRDPRTLHLRDLRLIPHGIPVRILRLPILRTLLRIADLLRIELGTLVLDRGKVVAEILEDVVDDRCRHETVQGLLGAAIRIAGKVGQRIDHRAGNARRVVQCQLRFRRTPFLRQGELDHRLLALRRNRAAVGFRLHHAVDIDGEFHLHRIRVIGGDRLHADGHLAFGNGFRNPVDPGLALRGDQRPPLHVASGC